MMKISEYKDQDINTTGTMVTSECGIQAASDTVCRGAQVTPLTRDAGCQYEEIPGKFINMNNIIKPSPIKQSPPKDNQDMFMAAKALQHLYQQSPVTSTLSTTILQSQIKALQDQALQDNLSRATTGSLKPETSHISSLLQPTVMNTLPLTSYALLLDMINKDTATNNQNILNHLTGLQHLSKEESSSLGALTTRTTKSSSSPLRERRSNPPSLFNTSNSNMQSLLSNNNYLHSVSNDSHSVTSSILSKSQQLSFNNHKRSHSDMMVKKDVDSLVDTVIDEHMNNTRRDNAASTYKDHLNSYNGNQHCLLSRDEYEMTPPFKRRRRTVFTERQLQGLEEAYSRSQYLDRESRLELCKKLGLSLHTVVYWFQNKRAISRRRGHSLDHSRSIENIHALASAGSSPVHLKHSPPTSPPNLMPYCTSPLNMAESMMTSLRSPPSSSIQSPASSVMSATITSNIPKSVLNISHMVGATI